MQKIVIFAILAVCIAVCSARPATTEQTSNSVSSVPCKFTPLIKIG